MIGTLRARAWQPAFLQSRRAERLKQIAKDFVHEFREDDLGGAAAELAFRFFLALFPFLFMLLTLGGVVSNLTGAKDPAQAVIDVFGASLPGDAASIIRKQTDQVVEGGNIGLLTIGFIGTVWAAGNGVSAMMKATNRMYGVSETRSFVKRTAMAVAVSFAGGGAIVVALLAILLSEVFAQNIAEALGLGTAYGWVVAVARIPLVLVLIAGAASVIYWLVPNTERPFRLVTPGAIVFALGWALASWGFALYVSHFANYNATYGALGGAVVLLIWLQLTSTLLLAGAELNSVLDGDADSAGAKAPASP